MRVHFHLAAFVELDAGAIGQQALARGAAAHGDQQLVHGQGLFAFRVGVGDHDFLLLALARDFGLRHLGAKADVEALLLELARGDLRHFTVGDGKEIG